MRPELRILKNFDGAMCVLEPGLAAQESSWTL